MALTNKLDAIGDAIRRKNGETDKYTLPQMVEKIDALPTGGDAYISVDKDWNMTGTIAAIDAYFTNSGTESKNPALQKNVASLKLDKATSVGQYAFYCCKNLTSVDMAACKSVDNYAFGFCSSLATISFPACTSIGTYAFSSCSKLTTLDFPACTSVGQYAFASCTALTTLNFPACTSVGADAFKTNRVNSVNFPKLKAIPNKTNGTSYYGFLQNSQIVTASFPACTSIGTYAFGSCSKLTTLDFSVCTSIQALAFGGSTAFTTLILRSETVATLGNVSAFTSTPIADGTGYIYVPDALVDSYKTATNWVTYAAQIKPLSELPTS